MPAHTRLPATNRIMNSGRIVSAYGIARSLFIYYRPLRVRQLQQFYTKFIRPDDLCFDIGAHAGNRVRAWMGLGARVVAVEPQPAFMALLRRLYSGSPAITLIEQAVGADCGQQTLFISRRTPTLTTLSQVWADTLSKHDTFRGVRWDDAVSVDVTTLDTLITQLGVPRFCKIDVEGYEHEVLRGLNQPLPCLSFEMIPPTLEIAFACLERLHDLGQYEYVFSAGESLRFAWQTWLPYEDMRQWLQQVDSNAPSGDIYARLVGED